MWRVEEVVYKLFASTKVLYTFGLKQLIMRIGTTLHERTFSMDPDKIKIKWLFLGESATTEQINHYMTRSFTVPGEVDGHLVKLTKNPKPGNYTVIWLPEYGEVPVYVSAYRQREFVCHPFGRQTIWPIKILTDQRPDQNRYFQK